MVDGTRGWLRVERSSVNPAEPRPAATACLLLLVPLRSCRDPGKTQKPLASAELEADNFDTYRVSSLDA